ncbi:MAG TPA: hypothetical protein DDZ42_14120 [Candidatus Rokubacteria bacterium]|nr:hypothetical protein [Candidatus Rokubacteria bacterium]
MAEQMDDELERIVRTAQVGREFVAGFVATYARLVVGRDVNELFLVPIILVDRAIRQHDAIRLLVQHGFTPEASVIGLTQFELCLDVLYVSGDLSRASEWMRHDSTRSAPWKVADKINDIWREDPKTRDAKRAYFEVLSAIKHGNPTAGPFGFPARATGNRLSVTSGEIEDDWSRTHAILIVASSTYHLVECLAGAAAAFGHFVPIDPGLEAKRGRLLAEWRNEAGKVAERIGVVRTDTVH